MINKIIKTFFNKKFIIFCIIGGLAYLVHQGVYSLYTQVLKLYDDPYHLISSGLGFIIASIFTYILNAKITYKTNMSKKTALESLVVYVLKFILTEGITFGIMAIMNNCFSKEDLFYKIVDILLTLILTCITLILQFLAFNVIFKTKNDKNENEASSN